MLKFDDSTSTQSTAEDTKVGVAEQWEWSPPPIRESIFCIELKNSNKTLYICFLLSLCTYSSKECQW